MVSKATRPRSSTSVSTVSSQRPKSRASTTSVQSAVAQPALTHQHASEQAYQYQPHSAVAQAAHYISDSSIKQQQQLQRQQQLAYHPATQVLDPTLHHQRRLYGLAGASDDEIMPSRPAPHIFRSFDELANEPMEYPNIDRSFDGNHTIVRPNLSRHPSFCGDEQQMQENGNDSQAFDDGAGGESRKKKGSASSIANDIELRKLFQENQGRPLMDVAAQVITHERGPKSEKTKQIFAMLWLHSVCKKSTGSVPRNRVFSRYAEKCGNERVPPLNPASFGKLVRIIFPGIQTRRLGMRGESKYHYVDLSLDDEHQHIRNIARGQSAGAFGMGQHVDGRNGVQRTHPTADTTLFPSPRSPFKARIINVRPCSFLDSGAVFHNPSAQEFDPIADGNMIPRELRFPIADEPVYHSEDLIELPSIYVHVPTGTDPDAADALSALYRSHCVSVIECLRFCKVKMLLHHFTSFHGTLTVPVQKLFAHPDLAPWIKQCDWLMYQKMIQFVSPLVLQAMPPLVIDAFRAVTDKLALHISSTFQNLPKHVRDARVGPATIFASLLNRVLRVNATAHAAANVLMKDVNRNQMWYDWVSFVKPFEVVESTLHTGYSQVLRILVWEIKDLLGPLSRTAHTGTPTIFDTPDTRATTHYSQHAHPDPNDTSPEGVLDRWTSFLHSLPTRFPGIDARLLVQFVNAVGSAALRDITMGQALSFGAWWVTKAWVDEMFQWLAERGGFMTQDPCASSSKESFGTRKRARSDFEADMGFTLDEDGEGFRGPGPRTALSASMDPPSRYGSVGFGQGEQNIAQITGSMDPPSRYQNIANIRTPVDNHSREASMSHQPQQQHQSNTQHHTKPSGSGMSTESHVALVAATAGLQDHDDSGIGMGIEDEDFGVTKYSGFIDENLNPNSDPANVVVC